MMAIIRAASGVVAVFQAEITKVISDAGFDVTTNILAMQPVPVQDQAKQVMDEQLASYRVIAYPLWLLAVSTSAYYAYRAYRLNNPKY